MDDDYVAQLLAKEAKESSIKYASQGLSAFMPSRPRVLQVLWLQLRRTVLPNDLMIVKYQDQETIGEEIGKIPIAHIEKELEVAPLRRNEAGRGGIDEQMKNMTELERETKTAMNIGANTGFMSHRGEIDGTEIRNTPGGDVIGHIQGLPAVLRTGTEVPSAIAIEDKNVYLSILLAPSPAPAHQSRTNLGDQSGKMHRHMAPAVLALKRTHVINESTPRRPVTGLMTKDDDWDMAMEALRDRERWRNKGEERLRKAGIDEAVIDKWKNNTAFAGVGGEGKPEDVQWSKKGEGREWDRGKFVNDDGHIDIRAAW
ncbi:hypothetical protein N7491_010615 [Penicillium cf. griseofulvum]|nr:hypothetical protein N7491_010615 [Penicillium cf. griseofulvum]